MRKRIVSLLVMALVTLSLVGCAGKPGPIVPRPMEVAYADMGPIWVSVQDNLVKNFDGVKKDGPHGLIFCKKKDPKKQRALINRINKYLSENYYKPSAMGADLYADIIRDQNIKDQYWIRLSSKLIQEEAYVRAKQEREIDDVGRRVYFSHKYVPSYSVKFIDG